MAESAFLNCWWKYSTRSRYYVLNKYSTVLVKIQKRTEEWPPTLSCQTYCSEVGASDVAVLPRFDVPKANFRAISIKIQRCNLKVDQARLEHLNMENCIESPTVSISANNICRICLQRVENANATNLFLGQTNSKEILDKIYLCFQIILNFENYLPSVICNSCIDELDTANNFRIKCVTFQERFAAYCKQKTSVVNAVHEDSCDEYERFELSASCRSGDDTFLEVNAFTENPISNTALTGDDNTFKCDICHKILKTKVSLLKHNISMHQKRKHIGKVTGTGVTRRYHCTKCLYSTPHSQTLVNHVRSHTGERPYHCYCGKSFTQSSSLSAHQKTHTNNKYFTCDTCGKQFKHAFTLKAHSHVHESGTFSCNICQKLLKTQKSLQEHMRRHYNIRNFNCEDCGATFVSSSDLSNHRKVHSIEKTAECHLCGYRTRAKKNLIVHLKRHTGEKPFKCELCAVCVYTRTDLRRHRRVHTREKPFACPACAQRFAHSPSLNKHMRNVHAVRYRHADNTGHDSKQTRKC